MLLGMIHRTVIRVMIHLQHQVMIHLQVILRRRQILVVASILGMYHHELYMNKTERRVAVESGYQ